MSLIERLLAREFEFDLSMTQLVYYTLERHVAQLLMRHSPPAMQGVNLLNLGCGPHIYSDWVNADDYSPKRRLCEPDFRPNWMLDITKPWRCAEDHWDGIFTEHVIEHLSYAKAVFVFRECFRTLKPNSWIRISVPSVERYVGYYRGDLSDQEFFHFPKRALALSFLTQMHMHRSTWDADLLTTVLREIGFENASEVSYGQGSDPRIVKDDPGKARESLYVEAQKPAP